MMRKQSYAMCSFTWLRGKINFPSQIFFLCFYYKSLCWWKRCHFPKCSVFLKYCLNLNYLQFNTNLKYLSLWSIWRKTLMAKLNEVQTRAKQSVQKNRPAYESATTTFAHDFTEWNRPLWKFIRRLHFLQTFFKNNKIGFTLYQAHDRYNENRNINGSWQFNDKKRNQIFEKKNFL